MAIFLDTAIVSEVERFHRMGIIRGVTTNPTIMQKDGVTGGLRAIEERTKAIASLIHPLPVFAEVTTNDPARMLTEAKAFSSWADNVGVKITVHGPEGELGNLEVVNELETREDIRVNVTAMMSAQQCLLAAMAGASYVSIFAGRVNNMGYDAGVEIAALRALLDRIGLGARIIAASTREVLNVIEWLQAGAHFVTVVPALLEGMLVHPYTKETVQMFLRDAAKLGPIT